MKKQQEVIMWLVVFMAVCVVCLITVQNVNVFFFSKFGVNT